MKKILALPLRAACVARRGADHPLGPVGVDQLLGCRRLVAGAHDNGGTGGNRAVKDNLGYNPLGMSAITLGASPAAYTTKAVPETVCTLQVGPSLRLRLEESWLLALYPAVLRPSLRLIPINQWS
jgi:hypothetical protein